jgi:hypothetical protein
MTGIAPGSWELAFELDKLSQAGVHMVRDDFFWKAVEPKKNEWKPEAFDRLVNLITGSGMEVLAILNYGVDWAMPHGSNSEVPPEFFADYVGYMARHFSGRIKYYEIGNEPDLFISWRPWPDPGHYGELLRASSRAIRENDPEARILFGGISPAESYFYGPNGSWQFLLKVHSHHPELCQWFDILAIHPYSFLQASSPEFGATEHPVFVYDLSGAVRQARRQLEKIGCPDKEIWITEMGWPDLFTGKDRQAAYLVRGIFLAMAEGVKCYAWYTFWDGANHSWNKEGAFGLFGWPGKNPEAKPAYGAMKIAHELFGGMKYAGDLGRKLGWKHECRGLAFADDHGRWALAIWKETSSPRSFSPVTVPLPEGANGWRLMDQEGGKISEGAAKTVSVKAGMKVVYLVFNIQHGS